MPPVTRSTRSTHSAMEGGRRVDVRWVTGRDSTADAG